MGDLLDRMEKVLCDAIRKASDPYPVPKWFYYNSNVMGRCAGAYLRKFFLTKVAKLMIQPGSNTIHMWVCERHAADTADWKRVATNLAAQGYDVRIVVVPTVS